jgi:hypothetical protein
VSAVDELPAPVRQALDSPSAGLRRLAVHARDLLLSYKPALVNQSAVSYSTAEEFAGQHAAHVLAVQVLTLVADCIRDDDVLAPEAEALSWLRHQLTEVKAERNDLWQRIARALRELRADNADDERVQFALAALTGEGPTP